MLALKISIAFAFFLFPLTVSAQPRIINVAPGTDPQGAINSAQAGDTIILQADASYVCPGGCILPNKAGSEYIVIKSSRYEEIPVRDFFSKQPSPEVAKLMARVSSSFSTEPVFRAEPGAHHYKLLGLNVTVPTGNATRLIELGVSGTAQDTLEEMPHHFVLDKNWLHAAPDQEMQRCLALNSSDNDITNNWITECHGLGYDTQGIASWNGGSNSRIINNSISAAAENYLTGGSPATIPNFVPTNIEFRRNYVWKPLSWYERDPSYAGRRWSVKNLFELKNSRNVVIEGNIFEGNWTDAQAGRAIVFTPRPSDSGSWAVIEDVQFINNIVRETGSGVLILGADEAPAPTETRLRRLAIKNNLFLIDGPRFGSNGFYLTVINKTEDVTVEHNTAIQTGHIIGSDYAPNIRFIYRDNISRHNEYGIFGGGKSTGNATIDYYFPEGIVTGNVMAKEVRGESSPSNYEGVYPAGNYFPEKLSDVGFVDLAGGNFRLSATSQYKGKGSNGGDPGCDIDALNAAIGGVTSPIPIPIPSPIATPSPTPTPQPSPSPSPIPTPEPTPEPSPEPPAPCTLDAPASISVPPNGIGKIGVSLNSMTPQVDQFLIRAVSATPGQVWVYPDFLPVTGTSAVIEFGVRVKKRSAIITFTSPCPQKQTVVMVR